VGDASSIVDHQSDRQLYWFGLSQAECDAAYDNSKAMADSPSLIAERVPPGPLHLMCPYADRERTKFDLNASHDATVFADLHALTRKVVDRGFLHLLDDGLATCVSLRLRSVCRVAGHPDIAFKRRHAFTLCVHNDFTRGHSYSLF
jgi:hypothetical protein